MVRIFDISILEEIIDYAFNQNYYVSIIDIVSVNWTTF